MQHSNEWCNLNYGYIEKISLLKVNKKERKWHYIKSSFYICYLFWRAAGVLSRSLPCKKYKKFSEMFWTKKFPEILITREFPKIWELLLGPVFISFSFLGLFHFTYFFLWAAGYQIREQLDQQKGDLSVENSNVYSVWSIKNYWFSCCCFFFVVRETIKTFSPIDRWDNIMY